MTVEVDGKMKGRKKLRGDPVDGLKEALGAAVVTRVPAEDILAWNRLSKNYALGWNNSIELARAVLKEFKAAAPWANPAVKNEWRWLKSPVPTEQNGFAQYNIRLPASERLALLAFVKELKSSYPGLVTSSFLYTLMTWTVHFRYPQGGHLAQAPKVYSPAEFEISDSVIEVPAMQVTEYRARKILAALGDTGPVNGYELPKRILAAAAGNQ